MPGFGRNRMLPRRLVGGLDASRAADLVLSCDRHSSGISGSVAATGRIGARSTRTPLLSCTDVGSCCRLRQTIHRTGRKARADMGGRISFVAKKSLRSIDELLHDVVPVSQHELNQRPPRRDPRHFEIKLDRQRFPVPGLLRFVMIERGCHDLGRWEKTAWQYPFQWNGALGLISLRKFGLRLEVWCESADQDRHEDEVQGLIGRLIASQRTAEALLQPIADQQFVAGNVTLQNQFHSQRATYEYFREGARLAFVGDGRLAGPSYFFGEQREGSYNTIAMCTAYFSYLEHFLVLSLPFLSHWSGSQSMNVRDFIGKKWGDKFRYVFAVSGDGSVNGLFSRLTSVAETYRNSYAHGAFGKEDATVHFHVPRVGAIPGNMTAVKDSPQYSFFPTGHEDFNTVCALFDECNSHLEADATRYAWEWISAGLDVRYDAAFVAEVQASVAARRFSNFIDRAAEDADRHANMDY